MKKTIVLAVLSLCAVVAAQAETYQNMKAGLWEKSMQQSTPGGQKVSLPKNKICVSTGMAKKYDHLLFLDPTVAPGVRCNERNKNRIENHITFNFNCELKGATMSGRLEVIKKMKNMLSICLPRSWS
jgi:hypothetical protein